MTDSKKLFPIQTKTSCRLKWSWSTLYLNSGTTSSCHRASFGEINVDNFKNFHNTLEKLADRQEMLDGKWPGGGCEYCRDIENSNGYSDRQFQNSIPNDYPQELDSNQELLSVNPVVLEVFFSNVCNFKCVYCNGKLSSGIQKEDDIFNDSWFAGPVHKKDMYNELVPKFWEWFHNNSQSLLRLHVLGGEPFLQKDYNLLLDYFEQNPHPNLEFNIITNLGVPTPLVEKSAKRLAALLQKKHLKRVDIQTSIDAWGPSQEYVRHGLKLDLFERNLELLMNYNCFRIGLLSTVSNLSIRDMPELAKKFIKWNQKQEIFWYMHFVAN